MRAVLALLLAAMLPGTAAAASTVDLTLAAEDGGWLLSIADDGHGFQPTSGDTTRRGLGLEGMRLRAEEMGGSGSGRLPWLAAPRW